MKSTQQTTFEKERGVNDVHIDAEVAHIVVSLPPEKETPDKHLDIYKGLGGTGMALRLVKMHPGGVSFAVDREDFAEAQETIRSLGYDFEAADNMVVLAITAVNMREMFGVMAKMAETLLRAEVETVQVGDAHDAVLCMVPGAQADTAVAALRTAFGL
jgi:aspartate kinase